MELAASKNNIFDEKTALELYIDLCAKALKQAQQSI
jgi:hypothetical protein